MNERRKIIIIISAILTVAIIVIAILLPSKSKLRNVDFYIFDSNNNSQYETHETLEFLVNDTAAVKNSKLVWHFGNGDTLIGNGSVEYRYKNEGKYLITLNISDKYSISKYIKVIASTEQKALDSIPRIHGVSQAYQDEELVFSAESPGADTWLWTFGESGTVDAYEQQVVYVYDTPGEYTIKLQTNTSEFPVYHEITILPRFEKVEEITAVDSLSIAQEDIKKHLQAIANTKVTDRKAFYTHVNYISNTYLCNTPEKVVVIVNGDKYNDFYSYCQGLHFLQNSQKVKTNIEQVKVQTDKCITVIHVTQSNITK